MLILYFVAKIPKIFGLGKLLILYLYLKILKLLFAHKFDVYVQHEKIDIYNVIAISLGGLETAILTVLIGLLIL